MRGWSHEVLEVPCSSGALPTLTRAREIEELGLLACSASAPYAVLGASVFWHDVKGLSGYVWKMLVSTTGAPTNQGFLDRGFLPCIGGRLPAGRLLCFSPVGCFRGVGALETGQVGA